MTAKLLLRPLALSIALLGAACSQDPADTSSSNTATDPVRDQVTLTPQADGLWRADFDFAEPGTEWVFVRSRGDYRTSTWTPITDGAAVVRKDGFDRIRLSDAGQAASFTFAPEAGPLDRTYDPALLFSDGSAALFINQFNLVPLSIVANEIAASQANPGDIDTGFACQQITFQTESRIIADGKSLQGPQTFSSNCGEPRSGYIYVGDLPLVEGESVTAVIDPALPDWLRATLDTELVNAFDALADEFGDPLEQKAVALVAFRGFDLEGVSQSVLEGMMVFSFEGDAFKSENKRLSRYLDWFFTHEAAHVFQRRNGQAPVRDQWIVEGHASAMAYRITAKENADGAEWVAAQQEQETEICDTALQSQSLREGLRDYPYECGQFVWRNLSDDLAKDFDALLSELRTQDMQLAPASTDDVLKILSDERMNAFQAALDGPGSAALDILRR